MSVLLLRDVTKTLGEQTILSGIHCKLDKGKCLVIAGPKGAGKSQLVDLLIGHSTPNSGEIFVLGFDVRTQAREIRSRVGIVSPQVGLDGAFSISENLDLFCRYNNLPNRRIRVEESLLEFKLQEVAHLNINSLTPFQRLKACLAMSLLNTPELLIFDDPCADLSSNERNWLTKFIQGLLENGKSIIYTTHLIEDIDILADELLVLQNGKALKSGNLKSMKEHLKFLQVLEFPIDARDSEYYMSRIRKANFEFYFMAIKFRFAYTKINITNKLSI